MSRPSAFFLVVVLAMFVGCAPLSHESFLKVETGMVRPKVRQIMGTNHLKEGHDYDYYDDGTRRAEIDYEDAEVVEKRWSGPTEAE